MASQPELIRRYVNGYKLARVLMTAERLGVFGALCGGPRRSSDLAVALSLELGRLEPLLNVLVNAGILVLEAQMYEIADAFSTLNPRHAGSQNGYLRYAQVVADKWVELADAVRGPGPATRNFSDITGGSPEEASAFAGAMNANALGQAAHLAKAYDFTNHRILDIGAGAGTYSIGIGRAYPGARGTLLEVPHMCEITADFVRKAGLSGRFSVVGGDYNASLPGGDYDDVLLFAVAHQEQPDALLRLLRRVYAALRPDATLFLSSFFLEESRTSPAFSAMFAVEMLVMVPSGHVYTYDEVRGLLEQAGFRGAELVREAPGPADWFVARRR